jgi:hypothetical protein
MDKYTYRMSSCGYCAKRLSLRRLGIEVEVPIALQTAAEEGNLHETAIKQKLTAEGWKVYDEQAEYIVEQPTFLLTGHIDGKVASQAGEIALLEIKSMSEGQFFKWKRLGFDAFPAYSAQLVSYLTVTDLASCLYVVKNRNSGFTDRKMLLRARDIPMGSLQAILDKLSYIEELAQRGEYVEATFDPESFECRMCEYTSRCIPIYEPSLQDSQKLTEAVSKYREGKKLEEESEQLIEAAKQVFIEHTEASKQIRWKFDNIAVRQQNGRSSLDRSVIEKYLTAEQVKEATKYGKPFLVITDMNKD